MVQSSLFSHGCPAVRHFLFAAVFLFIFAGCPILQAADVTQLRQALQPQSTPSPAKFDSQGDRLTARKGPARRRGCDRSAPPQYRKMKQNWQKVPKIKEPQWRNGYRDIVIYSVNLGERVRVFPFLPDGTLDPEAVTQIEQAFADKHSRATHAVHRRLIKLMYKLAMHFNAKQINLISGFRAETEGTESHHGNGSAMDIMIPGVSLPALAKVARRLGHVGVGFYPVSGFVHIDVREKASFFWVDPSGPGKASCLRRIMDSAGPKFDRPWTAAADLPVQKKDKAGIPVNPTDPPANPTIAAQNPVAKKTVKN